MHWKLNPQCSCLGEWRYGKGIQWGMAVHPGMNEYCCHRSELLLLEVSTLAKDEPGQSPPSCL